MSQQSKPLLALFLAISMLLSQLSMTNAAAQDDGDNAEYTIAKTVNAGMFDNGISWTLDENGLLYVTGTGNVPDFAFESNQFDDAKNVHTVVIEEGITEVGIKSFWGLYKLQEVFLPKSVKRLKREAFSNCTFTRIELSEGLEYIDERAFCLCSHFESIKLPESIKVISRDAFMGCESLKNFEIPYGFETVEAGLFNDCLALESVKIPSTVTRLEAGVFYRCSSLQTIDIPDSVTFLGSSLFAECSSLKEIKIPDGVAKIAENTFYNCSKLETVDFPSSLTSIGRNAFLGCRSLESITVPEAVQTIGDSAFLNCKNLRSVTLPDSVTSIRNECFGLCTSLEAITIPKNVTALGRDIFERDNNISDIYLYADPSTLRWENDQKTGCKENNETICHVLPQYLDLYQEKYSEKNVTFKAVDLNTRYSWDIIDGELCCIGEIVGEDGYVLRCETVTADEVVIDPTCEKDGLVTYTAVFDDESFETQTMDSAIPKKGHKWGIPEYDWTDSVCTAVQVCENDPSHIVTEKAVPIHTVIKAPTCEEDGKSLYEAAFENPAFSSQTKEIAEPAFGHKWSVTDWIWKGLSKVTVWLKCENDDSHKSTCDLPVSVTTIAPTCEEKGYSIYKAVYGDYSIERTETLDEIGHLWGSPIWEWNGDTANLVFCCEHNTLHRRQYPAEVSVTVVEPTKNSEGLKTYTATATADNAEFTTTRTEIIPKLPSNGICGDVDGDGNVTSADALSVLRMSASLEEYTPDIIPVADVDGDENITSADALDILRFSASLSANERIGQPI